MEDIGGDSIDKILARRAIGPVEALKIAIKVAEALGQLHQRNIIHKDVKPANVILAEDGHVQLIDFHLSSRLSRETAQMRNPNNIEGTLAYIAPEQTGRMNRPTGYRADLYSFGATLYTFLTGREPFDATNHLALVHCHLAVTPPAVHLINPDVPETVSRIVARLMQKTPEARYQSAFGVTRDLERCLEELEKTGTVSEFELATQDVSARFQVAQLLYGRHDERQELLTAFDFLGRARTQLVLVAGYSGVGKSRLVAELHKPMSENDGRFITGKFDQLSNAPYAPFIEAFRHLVRDILTEPPEAVARWKDALLTALGDSGRVLTEVISELEVVIGAQPPIPQLGPTEARNRFQHAVRSFLRAVATEEHPLVLFLDDLQWSDTATLDMLRQTLGDPEITHLLVIGAYRSNEVGDWHPFEIARKELKNLGVPVIELALQPLSFEALSQLVADTVGSPTAEVEGLARLVYDKTGGNPFFVDQFLRAIHAEGALDFDATSGRWTWDIDRIQAMGITDNVADLMARKVAALPEGTQNALRLAACIGARFDLRTLATAAQDSPTSVAQALWPALEALLVEPTGGTWRSAALMEDETTIDESQATASYRFQHDRVQEAAYALIAEEDRPE